MRHLYGIDFSPLSKDIPKDSPTPIWQRFGPDAPGGPWGLAAVADACAGGSRGVTSSKNDLFSIFYIYLYSATAFGCGARTSDCLQTVLRQVEVRIAKNA